MLFGKKRFVISSNQKALLAPTYFPIIDKKVDVS